MSVDDLPIELNVAVSAGVRGKYFEPPREARPALSRECETCGGTGWTWAILMPAGTLSPPALCPECDGRHDLPVSLPVDVFDMETQRLLELVGQLGRVLVVQDWLRGTWPRQRCWRMSVTRPTGARMDRRDARQLSVICRQILRTTETGHGA